MENNNIPETNEQMPKPQSMKKASRRLNTMMFIGLSLILVGFLLESIGGGNSGLAIIGYFLGAIGLVPLTIGAIQKAKKRSV